MKAADLIAERAPHAVEVPKEVLAELRKLCSYNDSCVNRNARVGRDAAIKLLAAHGIRVGSAGLDRIAREHLGRKSWAAA